MLLCSTFPEPRSEFCFYPSRELIICEEGFCFFSPVLWRMLICRTFSVASPWNDTFYELASATDHIDTHPLDLVCSAWSSSEYQHSDIFTSDELLGLYDNPHILINSTLGFSDDPKLELISTRKRCMLDNVK